MRPEISIGLLAGAAAGLSGAQATFAADIRDASTDEVRAIVAEMLADVDGRSSLLQGGGTAGHDGSHFFIGSADGNFRLNIEGQIQFRYNLNLRDDGGTTGSPPTSVDDFVPGFQTRRSKLGFNGHVFSPDLGYGVLFEFSRSGGAAALQEAYVTHALDNGMTLKWGQFKSPFLREELVSSKRQLAADRSNVNEVFNQGRAQGIQLSGDMNDTMRWDVMFSDGFNSANTDIAGDPADWAVTGRLETLLSGNWGQFSDFTSMQGSEEGMMLGLAGHVERGVDSPAVGGITEMFAGTVDLSYESDGWNLYGAFIARNLGGAQVDATDLGWVIQGGMYLSEDTEFFARYDGLSPDSKNVGDDLFNVITFGFNHYMHGHAAKFTTDVQIFIDDPATSTVAASNTASSAFGPNTGIGFLGGTNTDTEVALRFQFQLLF